MSESGYSSEEFDAEYFFKLELSRFKGGYKVNSLMTKSGNGTLYNGICRKTGREVVIKSIPRKNNLVWNSEGRKVPKEIKYHQIATSASSATVELIEYYEAKKTFILILEKPENSMDLFEFVKTYGSIDFDSATRIIKAVATACYQFHLAGMSHRDIKHENILFNPQTKNVKIIDFGCATK